MAREERVGLARALVALVLAGAGLVLELGFAFGVTRDLGGEVGGRLVARRLPRRGGGARDRAFDRFRLIVRPHVRRLGLQAARLRLQHQRLVHGVAGLERGERRECGEERRRERDLSEEGAALVLHLFVDALA